MGERYSLLAPHITMYKLALVVSALLCATSVSAVPSPSTTSSAATPTGSQIRTDQDPVYHLYLQNIGGEPQLGAEATSGYFDIGSTVALTGGASPLYLNVNMTATTSYKPVSFGTSSTTSWGLSGDTIIYEGTSGSVQNFLVCPITGSTNWNLFLQTGNDVPAGNACTDWITIHLPCLC